MTLKMTAAHSSRITKPSNSKTPLPLLRRTSSTSTPFSTFPRRKPSSTSASNPKTPRSQNNNNTNTTNEDEDEYDDDDEQPLQDHGLTPTPLANSLHHHRSVPKQIAYIHSHTFDAIPPRSGFNSVRIAEALNFRKRLPPVVTVAHVHALSGSATATEREIAELVRGGVVRKVCVPGRGGVGGAAVGECLVLTEGWVGAVRESEGLDDGLKDKYTTLLLRNPTLTTLPPTSFTPPEAALLTRAGFLTSATTLSTPPSTLSNLLTPLPTSHTALSTLSTSGSRAPAGSLAAVGGQSAIYDSGGGGGGSAFVASSSSAFSSNGQGWTLSLPSVGLYLKLLCSARAHLVALLTKYKYREAPLDMLRERWDGALATPERKGAAATGKAGFSEGAVLAVRTKKWKMFHGVRFQWVLEECVGSGLVECFETGSVGLGVRLCL